MRPIGLQQKHHNLKLNVNQRLSLHLPIFVDNVTKMRSFFGRRLLAKGITIGLVVMAKYHLNLHQNVVVIAVGAIIAMFLPQFLISLYSTFGLSVNSLKTIFFHIELLVLPSGITIANIFLVCVILIFFKSQISHSLK